MASQLSSKTITAVYGITQNYIAAFLRLSALAKINTSGQKLAKRREPCLLAACAATRRVAFAPGGAAAAGVKGASAPRRVRALTCLGRASAVCCHSPCG